MLHGLLPVRGIEGPSTHGYLISDFNHPSTDSRTLQMSQDSYSSVKKLFSRISILPMDWGEHSKAFTTINLDIGHKTLREITNYHAK